MEGDDALEFETSKGVKVVSTFDVMGLKETLLRGVYQFGFEKPSAIQQRAVLPIVEGRDVIAQAQSGTGKTSLIALTLCQLVDIRLNKCVGAGVGGQGGGQAEWRASFCRQGQQAAHGQLATGVSVTLDFVASRAGTVGLVALRPCRALRRPIPAPVVPALTTTCLWPVRRAAAPPRRPQALVVSPTRELATQTEQNISAIGSYEKIKAHACIGGKSISEDIRSLQMGQHIVSGTPGRVFDMIKRRELDTRCVGRGKGASGGWWSRAGGSAVRWRLGMVTGPCGVGLLGYCSGVAGWHSLGRSVLCGVARDSCYCLFAVCVGGTMPARGIASSGGSGPSCGGWLGLGCSVAGHTVHRRLQPPPVHLLPAAACLLVAGRSRRWCWMRPTRC